MSPSAAEEICFRPAAELAALLRRRELSAREVTAAHLAQIERWNPVVNAIVTLTAEAAMQAAAHADEAAAKGDFLGALHGLPVVHKDLHDTRGIRTTYGSPIFRDHVPDQDALIVERMKRAGAVTLGKSNTPEFGAGSQTFNPVFGATRNPWDPRLTCGGSSGGATVALACGMAALAGGSDMGGSLRNPASFCNVVGLRPSPGRVPQLSMHSAWQTLSVDGPMGRTVADVALALSAIAWPDPRDPISLEQGGAGFAQPLERDFRRIRVAWWKDLGGTVFDPRISAAVNARRQVFEELGCMVEQAEPDLAGADEIFRTFRAWLFELRLGELPAKHRGQIKETVIEEIERGRRLTGADIGRAEVLRTGLYHRVREFFERFDFFVLPVTQVPPFSLEEPWVKEIAGQRMSTYIDWMRSCYYISVTGCPAISVPCGFTPEGLPIGLQIVGRHRDDWGVLQLANAFEQATACWKLRPNNP